MNCAESKRLLHPYSDGELDVVRKLEMEQHLAECTDCAAMEEGLRQLRTTIASALPYHRAPSRLQLAIQRPPAPSSRARVPVQLAATAAGILLMLATTATIGITIARMQNSNHRTEEWVIAAHVRSQQVAHLMDVASDDRHTVKPWFRDKLDFSPAIPDLKDDGYPLSGGRLDYIIDHPVAALVYQRRLHAINVFTWLAADDGETAIHPESRQGFHIRHWQRSGMSYWVISDLNDHELDEFVRLFREESIGKSP